MRKVYSYCVLNIAVDHAENPFQGCYSIRKSYLAHQPQVMWHGFRQGKSLYKIHFSEICGRVALQSSRLSSRGWVMQERFLSPRVVHFTTDHILWECSQLPLACECTPVGFPNDCLNYYGRRPFNANVNTQRRKRPSDGHSTTPPSVQEPWLWIVEEYSKCGLTKPDEDKLVALAGVAQALSIQRQDQYAAGFFRSDIIWSLIWWVDRDSAQNIRPLGPSKVYRAPSWSWACINGKVGTGLGIYISSNRFHLLAEMHSADIGLCDPFNPYGAVSSAVLRLKGNTTLYTRSNSSYRFAWPGLTSGEHFFLPKYDTQESSDLDDTLTLLPLILQSNTYIHGLVLCMLSKEVRFKRVGSFTYSMKLEMSEQQIYNVICNPSQRDLIEII
jgi:hypothetical protein